MKYIFIIIILIAAAFTLYPVFKSEGTGELQNSLALNSTSVTSTPVWETKTDTQESVTIAATPLDLDATADTWKFEISFDTHSVDLDEDPLKVATLIDERGNANQPVAWEGPGPGGHHRSGILVFNSMPGAKVLELKIVNVGGVPERSLVWNL